MTSNVKSVAFRLSLWSPLSNAVLMWLFLVSPAYADVKPEEPKDDPRKFSREIQSAAAMQVTWDAFLRNLSSGNIRAASRFLVPSQRDEFVRQGNGARGLSVLQDVLDRGIKANCRLTSDEKGIGYCTVTLPNDNGGLFDTRQGFSFLDNVWYIDWGK